MDKITVGVLTISDRCSRKEATDESGPNLIRMLESGLVKNCTVVKTGLVPDRKEEIEAVLKEWTDDSVNLILTTGGTGIAKTDVTPEATAEVLDKTIPGISQLMFKVSSELTHLAALSRGLAGVRQKSLIVNLPGSRKASKECLEAVARVIPHAIDLINGKKKEVERVHASLVGDKRSSFVNPKSAERKRLSPYVCVSVAEAQKIVLDVVFALRKETFVGFQTALSHVLAQDVVAKDNLPPCSVSLKDGYAVRSTDRKSVLQVVAVSKAGDDALDRPIPSGCCARINTGAPMPPDTDAVVMVEQTIVSTEKDGEEETIRLNRFPAKHEEVRLRGSDFKIGQLILPCKTYLDSSALGLCAAAGIHTLRVYEKPLVAVFSTGDEIVDPEETVTLGKVRDSNRITLISLMREEGFRAEDLGIVKDEPNALRDALERGFRTADVVVTTGSMSMGERDYLKDVLVADFGADVHFGRVQMKPGKPTCFATLTFDGKMKFFFGLPGNPASAFVTSHLFVLPALRKISGREDVFPLEVRTKVVNPIPLEDRPHYVRGKVTVNESGQLLATVTGDQRSSKISSCVGANSLLIFPMLSNKPPAEVYTQNQHSRFNAPKQPSPPSEPSDEVKALVIGKIFI